MYIFGGGDGKMWLSDLYKFNLGNFLIFYLFFIKKIFYKVTKMW